MNDYLLMFTRCAAYFLEPYLMSGKIVGHGTWDRYHKVLDRGIP
jgi:hypothetical protein